MCSNEDQPVEIVRVPRFAGGIIDITHVDVGAWSTYALKCNDDCPGHVVVSCVTGERSNMNLILSPRDARELRRALAPALHDLDDESVSWTERGMIAGKRPLETDVAAVRIDVVLGA